MFKRDLQLTNYTPISLTIRFTELPTQSVWCTLHGVIPPGRNILPNYPKAISEFFRCYEGKTAVAVFEHWIGSNVVNPLLKLRAYVVL